MKTAIALGDIHYPFHNQTTINIIKKVAKDLKPDYLIFGGDNWNADGISKFSSKAPDEGLIETFNEMNEFHEKIFKMIQKSCHNDNLITHLILGNHDGQRLTDFLNKAKEKGHNNIYNYWNNQFNYEKIFNCKITQYNDYIKIGKMNITHGEKHNKYHASSHLDIYMSSILHFHLHTNQIYTRISKGNDAHQGISAPCCCDTNPDYLKNKANTWINGFVIIYFLPNGNFFYEIKQIIDKQTIVNGKIYK